MNKIMCSALLLAYNNHSISVSYYYYSCFYVGMHDVPSFFQNSFTLIAYFYTVLERGEHLVSMQYFEYVRVEYHFE